MEKVREKGLNEINVYIGRDQCWYDIFQLAPYACELVEIKLIAGSLQFKVETFPLALFDYEGAKEIHKKALELGKQMQTEGFRVGVVGMKRWSLDEFKEFQMEFARSHQ